MTASANRQTATGNWWRRRSLKLRLAACFTGVASAVMLALIPIIYGMVEKRLHLELDRQLRIDWDLVEAHLTANPGGKIHWRRNSPAQPTSPGYASTWFDVWSGGEMVLSHWPEHGAAPLHAPQQGEPGSGHFYNVRLSNDLPGRTFQRPARIDGHDFTLRVFRDESGIRETMREILAGLALGLPIAILLSAMGGYLMAGRALQPLREMIGQAQEITSESLARRLPNPNPHDELGELATVFNRTLERLEISFTSLKRFTADASHELRTPLTALRSVGEISLRGEPGTPALRETIGSMLEEAQRLNDLIDTMLMFARVEGGRANLQLEAVAVDATITEVCENLEVLAGEKNQRIATELEPGLSVRADRTLLRHAVMNILHNAIRHGPPASDIRVACFRRGAEVLVEITDEGQAIAAEHREKVFERFYRIDRARSRADGGAGLGLAIARLSVEQIGGTLELAAASGSDTGNCFRISLPTES
jgi:heavy metal sensor kinase